MSLIEKYAITIGVLKEINNAETQGIIETIEKMRQEEIEKSNNELRLAHTIYYIEDYDSFKEHIRDILEGELIDKTPHGEYGGDIEGIFYWKGNSYRAYLDPFWNRHDKQYYYIDGISTFTVELIEK